MTIHAHQGRAYDLLNLVVVVIEGDELVIKDDDFHTLRRVPKSHGISGAVATDGEMLSLDNALADERFVEAGVHWPPLTSERRRAGFWSGGT